MSEARAEPRGGRLSDWWLYAARGLVVALQALVFLLFAALMSPDEFGRFAFAIAAARMVAAVVSGGMAGYLLREIPSRLARGERPLSLGRIALLGVGLPLIATLGAALAVGELPVEFAAFSGVETGGGTLVTAILALGFAFSVVGVAGTLVRVGAGSLAGMAVQQALPFAALALAMVPRLFGIDYGVIDLLTAAAALLIGTSGLMILWQTRPTMPGAASGGATPGLGRALREAAPFWGNGVLIALATQLDIVIAALFIPSAELGSYALIRNIANLVAIPRMIANWAIATRVARAWAAGDREGLRRSADEGRRLSARPALAGAGAIALAAPLWFTLYGVPAGAAWPWLVLGFLLGANLATALLGLAIIYASQCGLEALTLRVRIGALVLGAAVSAAGGAIAGSPGVALGSLVLTLALNATMTVAVRARTGIATI